MSKRATEYWPLINHHRVAIALAGLPYPPLACAVSIDHPWLGAPGVPGIGHSAR